MCIHSIWNIFQRAREAKVTLYYYPLSHFPASLWVRKNLGTINKRAVYCFSLCRASCRCTANTKKKPRFHIVVVVKVQVEKLLLFPGIRSSTLINPDVCCIYLAHPRLTLVSYRKNSHYTAFVVCYLCTCKIVTLIYQYWQIMLNVTWNLSIYGRYKFDHTSVMIINLSHSFWTP